LRAVIRPRFFTTLAAIAATLLLAACGGGTKTAAIPSEDASTSSTSTAAETETTTKPSPPTGAVKALASGVGTNTKKKPKVGKPKGDPPGKLISDDIVDGKGDAAKPGDQLTVDYVGVNWSNGKEFDASWNRKQTFPLTLGQGGVIEGWDAGLVGMKEGGRRMLVIPPDLGYGASGSPPTIGPNETLVFVIDLRKIG
jgi:peptidylprolyl isomerase